LIAARKTGQLELVAFGWFRWHPERQIVDLRPPGIQPFRPRYAVLLASLLVLSPELSLYYFE
jgi:hypothetical protein